MSTYTKKESDIFGGKQWTREQQFAEELNAIGGELKNIIESHGRKLSTQENIEIDDFIKKLKKDCKPNNYDDPDHPLNRHDEGQMYNKWLDKHDKTSEHGGV